MDRNCPRQTIKPKREEMTAIIQRTVKPVQRKETVPFYLSNGRICAEDVYSKNTLPNNPVSRFDGIAVRFSDFESGIHKNRLYIPGQDFEYCNTGIAIPKGYDTVVAIEDVAMEENGMARIQAPPKFKGAMVNGIGSNLKAGERLISKNQVITPAHIGLFASGGVMEILVYDKPRVAIIPTGTELVNPTDQVPVGRNIESNSYMISAYLEQWGAAPTRFPISEDDPKTIKDTLENALSAHDAVIIIAGSSLGTKDYTLRILKEMGEVAVPELAHGPGRKSSLSVVNQKPVLGVAGPPLGAQITCDLYLSPFVSALRGLPHIQLARLEVVCDDPFEEHEVDFCERVHIYKNKNHTYHIRSAFAPITTRAQMQALSNGNFYRKAGTSCHPGEQTTVELLCPLEYVPAKDLLPEIINEEEK